MGARPERTRLVPLFSRMIRELKPKPRSILDVGCGYLGPHFKREFKRAYKCLELEDADVNSDYLGHAEAIPLEDNEVEIVTAFSVIEHVLNPYNALLEMSRVAKIGVLLTTDLTERDKNSDPTHLYCWTPKVFGQLLERAAREVGWNAKVWTISNPTMTVGVLIK